MLFQIASNQFLVVKRTYFSIVCLLIGFLVNIILNYFWIEKFGIKGVAAATLIGYTTIVISVIVFTVKLKLLRIKFRFIITTMLIAGIFKSLFCNNGRVSYWLLFITGVYIAYMYRYEVNEFYKLIKE